MFVRKSYIRHGLKCLKQLFLFSLSLHQDVTHGFDVFVSIMRWIWSFVSARVELETSCFNPVPNPILESQVEQWFPWLATIPMRALEWELSNRALNPSLLQLTCKEASEPISSFHVSRPSVALRYCPSAISEYGELACLLMTMKLICWPIFIPRQILEKDVFQ